MVELGSSKGTQALRLQATTVVEHTKSNSSMAYTYVQVVDISEYNILLDCYPWYNLYHIETVNYNSVLCKLLLYITGVYDR